MQSFEVGRKLKDTLMGEARQGVGHFVNPVTGQRSSVDVLLKSFNKQCVLAGTTLSGQHVQEDPRTELMIQTRLSSASSYPASLLSSPQYLQRIAVQSSSYIVKLYDVKDVGDDIVAIMEFCHNGELFSLLHASGSAFTISHAKSYFVQLLLAVSAIHSLDVVHRDISLENILLTASNALRICDFGLAREVRRGEKLEERSAVGKIRYMSPEVFSCIGYDGFASDLWSCGVCLFVMVMKVFPWNIPHASDPLFVMICSGRINDVMKGWGRRQLDDQLVDLFSHIFCPEERRWSIQQLLDSDWLRGVWMGPREGMLPSSAAAAPSAAATAAARPAAGTPTVPPGATSRSVAVAVSAPASVSISAAPSPESSPAGSDATSGATSPLSLFNASMDDLSAEDAALPQFPSPSPFSQSASSDSPHITRSLSPSGALSPVNTASAFDAQQRQQQLGFFGIRETAVTRAIELAEQPQQSSASASCSSSSLSSSSSFPSPLLRVPLAPTATAHGRLINLYPTASDIRTVNVSRLPAGPSLEHSASRRDRLSSSAQQQHPPDHVVA